MGSSNLTRLKQRVFPRDVLSMDIPRDAFPLLHDMAKKASIGGSSQVRDAANRQSAMAEDQLLGQLGQYALSVYLTGNDLAYRKARCKANQSPLKGDGGFDILGLKVDVKTSRMRYSQDALAYQLIVPPSERHPDWTYVLALIPKDCNNRVYLVGWLRDCDFTPAPNGTGSKTGKFVRDACELSPLPPLQWLQSPAPVCNLSDSRTDIEVPIEVWDDGDVLDGL